MHHFRSISCPAVVLQLIVCLSLCVQLNAERVPAEVSSLSVKGKGVAEELMMRVTRNFMLRNPLARGKYRFGDWEDIEKSTLPKTCYWSYPTGVSLLALQRVAGITGAGDVLKFVVENNEISAEQYGYLRWQQAKYGKVFRTSGFEKLWRLRMLDDCGAMGAQMLDSVLRHNVTFTPNEEKLIEIIGEFVTKQQSRLPDGSFWRPESPDGPTLWADDLFMGVPFLVRWSEYKKDSAALDDAARQVINYAARLQDTDGAWFHAYFVDERQPNGIKWGRANGWVAIAIAELLSAMPSDHQQRSMILDIFRRQMEGLRKLQSPSGMWHQVIDHPELTWGTETSCSAQFTYAMARGVNRGWLDDSYRKNLKSALAGLSGQVTEDGNIRNVCPSTSIGRDLSYYNERIRKENDWHGPGLMLLALTEMLAVNSNDQPGK